MQSALFVVSSTPVSATDKENAAMSGMINVRRDVQDPFYRYKMPRIQSKIEGKGNGIKTVIPNLPEVGKALGRPPAYIIKFFGAEVGALSTVDERGQKYIVNGVHDAEKLQTLLDGFIGKFVLCAACENPETHLSVSKKDGTVYRLCQACGHRSTVDMLHKLVTFIRANPPPKPPKRTQARDRADDASHMAAEAAGPSPLGGESVSAADATVLDAGVDAELDEETVAAMAARRGGDDEDWAEEDAERMRAAELATLSESVRAKLAVSSGPSCEVPATKGSGELDALDAFADWLSGEVGTPDAASNARVLSEAERRGISNAHAVVVVAQVLLAADKATETLAAAAGRAPMLATLVSGDRGVARALLGSVERLAATAMPAQMLQQPRALAALLQLLYDRDVVDEEDLVEWNARPSKRFATREDAARVRAVAKPFFDWLAASEDESDESE